MGLVELLVEGAVRGADDAPPYAMPWEAGREPLGEHMLQARTVDVAGNAAVTAPLKVATVPTTPEGVLATATQCRRVLAQAVCPGPPPP